MDSLPILAPKEAGGSGGERNSNISLRVCYFGTFRRQYSRNRIMIEALRRCGGQVTVCHERVWSGTPERVAVAAGGWRSPKFLLRILRAYLKLSLRYLRGPSVDIVMLGYPGVLDVFVAFLLTKFTRTPLVWDVFMSVYLIARERSVHHRSGSSVWLLRRLERWATRLPDLLILDTGAYKEWFRVHHGVEPARVRLVPTGADDRFFYPVEANRSDRSIFSLLYYGTFIPNHGIDVIVEAARELRAHRDIRFELIGDGPEKAAAIAFCERHELRNVRFEGWIQPEELRERISNADLCLGAFGITPQSLMTIQNKIYEAMAVGRPVLSGDSPVARETLEHGRSVYLCERENPHALARAILEFKDNPGLLRKIAEGGRSLYSSKYTPDALGRVLRSHLEELMPHALQADRAKRGTPDP